MNCVNCVNCVDCVNCVNCVDGGVITVEKVYRSFEKVYRSSKWWEVKDWGESVSELMIVKEKQLQETVHSTLLLGCFYLLYML